jgi:hypothetical protein
MMVDFNKKEMDLNYEKRLRCIVVFVAVCIGGIFFYIVGGHC